MMENNHSPHLLLILLLLLAMLTTTTSNPTPAPPPLPPAMQQLNNIIDALIGAGDFSSWVSILSTANSTVLPVSATLFIPQDNTLDHPPVDPFLFPYHVIPQRLTFSDLLLFPLNSHLPTLLPGKSISVTGNTPSNFSLNNTPLTHPDLYSTASVAVHGVEAVLDYSEHRLPPATSPPFFPAGDSAIGVGWSTSDARCTRLKCIYFTFLVAFFFEDIVFGRFCRPFYMCIDFWETLFMCFVKALFAFVAHSMFD